MQIQILRSAAPPVSFSQLNTFNCRSQGCTGKSFVSVGSNGSYYERLLLKRTSRTRNKNVIVDHAVTAAAASSTPQTTGLASGAPGSEATVGDGCQYRASGGLQCCCFYKPIFSPIFWTRFVLNLHFHLYTCISVVSGQAYEHTIIL